jgi:hypothetical protein
MTDCLRGDAIGRSGLRTAHRAVVESAVAEFGAHRMSGAQKLAAELVGKLEPIYPQVVLCGLWIEVDETEPFERGDGATRAISFAFRSSSAAICAFSRLRSLLTSASCVFPRCLVAERPARALPLRPLSLKYKPMNLVPINVDERKLGALRRDRRRPRPDGIELWPEAPGLTQWARHRRS